MTDRPRRLHLPGWRLWFTGLVVAAALAGLAKHVEVAQVIAALGHITPIWLAVACALQVITYWCAAMVWRVGLGAQGHDQRTGTLMSFALAMLFSNQAVPSVGLSGGFLVVKALGKRNVPEPVAVSTLVLGLVTTYATFLLALGVAFATPGVRHTRYGLALAGAAGGAFLLMAVIVTTVLVRLPALSEGLRARLNRLPIVGDSLRTLAGTSAKLLTNVPVMCQALFWQFAEIVVDAATLAVSLIAIGHPVSAGAAFGSYVIASVASRVAFVPLGIGTFEATCIALLHAADVPLHTAAAGTLLFRGFTLWLPMLPGIWFARQALGGTAQA